MEGQQAWAAKAAGSYQELARVFSAYVTDRQEEVCDCSTVPKEDGCEACPKVARLRRSAYRQMMEGKEALVYQLEETARYFSEMEASLKREQYLSEEEKRELVFFLRRYHIKVRSIETAYRAGKGAYVVAEM